MTLLWMIWLIIVINGIFYLLMPLVKLFLEDDDTFYGIL